MDFYVIGKADFDMIRRILDSAEKVNTMAGDERVAAESAPAIHGEAAFGKQTVVKPPVNLEAIVGGVAKPLPKQYALGATSLKRLAEPVPIKPELGATIKLAITLSTQDFTVLEVYRTLQRQQQLLAEGATRTLKSKHLKQPDGFVWAGDLGAWNNGTVTWGFEDYFEIVQAMDKAATRLGYAEHIRWGGIWDMVLADYGGDLVSLYRTAIEQYKVRHPGKDFLDGPHFEWVA